MPNQVGKPGMRKKLKMRSGGKVAKYAEGGRVGGPRPQEDRAAMAAEAAAGFDAEEERMAARRRAANPWLRGESLLTNRPVGAAPRAAGPAPMAPMPAGADVDGTGTGAAARPTARALPTPPIPPRGRTASGSGAVRRARPREMSADDLNERELARIAPGVVPAPRNMYRKGGVVRAKKGSK